MHTMTQQAIAHWQAEIAKHYAKHLDKLEPPTLTLMPGRKYIRVVVEAPGQRSVFCFLDKDGNIYKAEGWKAPARGIRGHIEDNNFSFGRGVGVYGGAYAYR